MVSSLISPQYHDGQFWKFSQSSEAGGLNDFDTAVVPQFSSDFQVDTYLEISMLDILEPSLYYAGYRYFKLNIFSVRSLPRHQRRRDPVRGRRPRHAAGGRGHPRPGVSST